jgi:glucokinase
MRVSIVFMGVDIGGTSAKVGMVDEEGQLLGSRQVVTSSRSEPREVIDKIFKAAGELLAGSGRSWANVEAVGVGCAGLIRASTSVLVTSPNLPKWENAPLGRILASATDSEVFLDNDVNAFTYAESRVGAARGKSYGVFLALGTGVGGGLLLDGEIYRGYNGFGAELGHFVIDPDGPVCECGNRGCFESLVRSRTVVETAVAYYRKAGRESDLARIAEGDLSRLTPEALCGAACAGDDTAAAVFKDTGRWLGIAIGGLINIFNPEIVVIGGGIAQAAELLLGPARHWAGRYAFSASYASASIVTASLGENAGMIGAALEARDKSGIPCG